MVVDVDDWFNAQHFAERGGGGRNAAAAAQVVQIGNGNPMVDLVLEGIQIIYQRLPRKAPGHALRRRA